MRVACRYLKTMSRKPPDHGRSWHRLRANGTDRAPSVPGFHLTYVHFPRFVNFYGMRQVAEERLERLRAGHSHREKAEKFGLSFLWAVHTSLLEFDTSTLFLQIVQNSRAHHQLPLRPPTLTTGG